MPEQDLPWLESWARAVVDASTTDQSERLQAEGNAQTHTQSPGNHNDALVPLDDGVERGQDVLFRSVQDRRRAMKEAVRGRYAFSATARLWAEEMTRETRPRPHRDQENG